MTNKRIICRWLSVAILLASFCVSASATVMEYTDQTAYLSATSNLTTITFSGIGSGNNFDVTYNNSGGLIVGGNVTFEGYGSTNNYSLEVEDRPTDWGNGAYLVGPTDFNTNVSGIIVTLPAGVFAVGSNVMAAGGGNPDPTTVNVQLSSAGTLYPVTTVGAFSSMAFVGFTSTTAITSISFFSPTTGSDQPVIDNFDFGQTDSPTPEAGTSLLCGSGLILMVRFLRRRQSLPPVA
jgi:hypothetical protein